MRRLHEKLFYRPLLGAVAKLPGSEARLSLEAAEARLSALGYADPKAALRHLEALPSGVSRTSDIQRTLLPVLLEWFADSPDPDAGLFGFRRISETLGDTPWYLRQLRDWKGSAEIEVMIPEGMRAYGELCGWTLARAHARSGDRIAIAAYLGSGAAFDVAVGEFAQAYADQNERDYAALMAAIGSIATRGRVI